MVSYRRRTAYPSACATTVLPRPGSFCEIGPKPRPGSIPILTLDGASWDTGQMEQKQLSRNDSDFYPLLPSSPWDAMDWDEKEKA